jgi:hypothetical protein
MFCVALFLSPLVGLLLAIAQTDKRLEKLEQERHAELLQAIRGRRGQKMRLVKLTALTLLMAFGAAQAEPPETRSNVSASQKPTDIPQDVFELVRTKCAEEWPTNFHMRVYCENREYDAIRKLGLAK